MRDGCREAEGAGVTVAGEYGPEFGYTLATGRLFCDFAAFQEWASDLIGRPLMTHDFASQIVWQELRDAFEVDATERADKTDRSQADG